MSGFRYVPNPTSNEFQHNLWNGRDNRRAFNPYTQQVDFDPLAAHEGPTRHAPEEPAYIQHDPVLGGWYQGGRKLRNFKPNYYWARPVDGKRRGTLGRLKDGVTGEGPDVFLVANGDRRSRMQDMPHRHAWAGWGAPFGEDMDSTDDNRFSWAAPWAARSKPYNFRTREYERPTPKWFRPGHVWTDVDWAEKARHGSKKPLSKRDINFMWQSRVPWTAGFFPGGRPRI